MQGAIEARDARAALNLIRRYNLDKVQLERQHNQEQQDNEQAYKRELRQLAQQRLEKRKQAQQDYQRSLADLALAQQRELDTITLWKQRQLEDATLWKKRERADALEHYKRSLVDIDKHLNDQLVLTAKKMKDKFKLNHTYLDLLYKDLKNYIDDDGVLTQLWKNYYDLINGVNMSTPNISTPPIPTNPTGGIGRYAEGGTVFANKPTLALFGEHGNEYATFTPANKISNNMPGGKLGIELLLSPDLQARIVNDALGQFADVIVEVKKEQR